MKPFKIQISVTYDLLKAVPYSEYVKPTMSYFTNALLRPLSASRFDWLYFVHVRFKDNCYILNNHFKDGKSDKGMYADHNSAFLCS